MNKIENDTNSSREEGRQNTNSVLWWMKKGKNAIYVQFVNNMMLS
jgi:hypothetical protein